MAYSTGKNVSGEQFTKGVSLNVGAVRNDAGTALVLDGELTPLSVDSSGNLRTTMSGDIQIGAVEIKDGASDQRATVDSNGNLMVSLDGGVDAGNSTSTPLSGGATWTGTTKDINEYNNIVVSIYANVASATDGFVIERSADGNTFYRNDTYTIAAGAQKTFTFQRCARYYRLRYTNGGSAQSTFVITAGISKLYMKGSSHRIADSVSLQDDAELMKSVICGETSAGGGSFVNVKVNPSGTLETNVNQSTASNLNAQVVGTVADNGSDSGNPVKVGGKYNATLPTYADGDRADLQVDSRGRLVTSGSSVSGSLTNAEYQSPYDFTATYTSNVTITVTNASFTVDDTVCTVTDIRYKPTGGSWTSLVNGGNGVSITASSNVITVSGAGTPFASGDTYKIGIDYQQKAFDITTDTQKNTIQNPEPSYYVDVVSLISAAQDVTTSRADLGFEIPTQGYKWMKLRVTIDINNATDFRFKLLGKHTSAGTEEYPFDITKWTVRASTMSDDETYRELNRDADDLYIIEVDLDNNTPYIQVQIQAAVAGATAGQCDAAYYTLGY